MTGARPLLFDFGPLDACCTDHALEALYKALADSPEKLSLWSEHHDPYVRAHLENVTARGMAILARIQADILALAGGKGDAVFGEPRGRLGKAFRWTRWSQPDMDAMRAQLADTRPDEYTLEDWMMAVDWIVHRYLPDGVIDSESQYLAVRAQIAGKIEAQMGPDAPDGQIDRAVSDLPVTAAAVPFAWSDREQITLDFARARAGELIRDLGDKTRHRVNTLLVAHESRRLMNDPEASLWALQSNLQDEFAVLNRDWRRVAVTEIARDTNEGMIAGLAPGTRVKRVEAYAGACPFCRKINGMVFTVVDPADPKKQAWSDVWVGKTNVDRSASPRKRVGDELVERTPEEMWWPAAGTQHPNCRGGWVMSHERPDAVDPAFADWLEDRLKDA